MNRELEAATNATLEAGKILLDFYDTDYAVDDKGTSPMYSGSNPVTDADRAADTYLRETLTGEFPDYGWFSEETKRFTGAVVQRRGSGLSIPSMVPKSSSRKSPCG